MRSNLVLLLALLLSLPIIAEAQSVAPIPPPPPPTGRSKLGKAEIQYFKDSDISRVHVQSYLVGGIDDFYKGNDTVLQNWSYRIRGKEPAAPMSVNFWILFDSKSGPRHANNHKIAFFADKRVVLELDSNVAHSARNERNQYVETYEIPALSYLVVLTLSRAKEVEIQVGDARYLLDKDALQALRDFEATTRPSPPLS